ncbi:MAG: hypothetical protein IJQ35_06195 [Bacteroidales bacterium]|nr:hypothetical protein [Synergistaceae bacterium]MBQ6911739.1 hypothetical protein [Bacteroidales bacterium]
MTGEALIHHFMNRLWMFLWTPLSPTDWEHTSKWEEELADKSISLTGMIADGLIFGEMQGSVRIAKPLSPSACFMKTNWTSKRNSTTTMPT